MAPKPHTVFTPERRKALAAAQLHAIKNESFAVTSIRKAASASSWTSS